jgi:hypothetical protein
MRQKVVAKSVENTSAQARNGKLICFKTYKFLGIFDSGGALRFSGRMCRLDLSGAGWCGVTGPGKGI